MLAHEKPLSADVLSRAAAVRLMIFDVDGILTDGSLHFGADGEAFKTFNVLDGHGIKLLQQVGIATAIISARSSAFVARRAADLGIVHLQQGVHDKLGGFRQLTQELGLDAAAVGFIGDDLIDLPILSRCGFAASVPGGHPEVRSRVHYVTANGGGRGAAREVCDLILRAQGHFDRIVAASLA